MDKKLRLNTHELRKVLGQVSPRAIKPSVSPRNLANLNHIRLSPKNEANSNLGLSPVKDLSAGRQDDQSEFYGTLI